jgi:peptidyl-dipeptidase Dcp
MMMNKRNTGNPLLSEWTAPFGSPPFDLVKPEHYLPAAEEAIRQAGLEIDRIVSEPAPPDFFNTVEALETCGENVGRVAAVLFNLNSAETSQELQKTAQDVSPLLARFSNDITLNEKLFERIRSVYFSDKKETLNTEQKMLLERKYRSFIFGGAGLDEVKKNRFREISEELAGLGLKFEENVLEETNAWVLHLTDPSDLAGLPDSIIEAAHAEAAARKLGGWLFTLHYPSYVPFMQYSDRRELREKMLRAFTSRSFRGNENDNRELVVRIVNLKQELAALLGYSTYADMALEDRMAENRTNVESFLGSLYTAAHPAALRDYENVKSFAAGLGLKSPLERWDWAYYSEKLKRSKFDIDDEILKPYFSLESVREAIFGLAGKLYGISFHARDTIPLYHPEVRTWEVKDPEDRFLALFFADFHPRQGKSGGAWMTCYREQRIENGTDIRPIVSIVTNFSRPSATKPSLLTFTELTTFLHEFGHALHAILTRCTYESLSGTNVARDFVELPSQFMENFAFQKEWLDEWAVHYLNGEKIPVRLIEKIKEASTFNEGYACERQLGFGFLDMAWHTLGVSFNGMVDEFESETLRKTDLFPKVDTSNISCSFTHLFGGGYAAGYYGYKWAEVLDADAFWFFLEKGIFSRETADAFRINILEKGATEKPAELYRRFRGKEPSNEAFLIRSGLRQ